MNKLYCKIYGHHIVGLSCKRCGKSLIKEGISIIRAQEIEEGKLLSKVVWTNL